MDRRTTLAKLFGKSQVDQTTTTTANTVVVSGLDPYTGPFEIEQAAHLLRRTMFGPTYQQIKDAVADGLDATLSSLLADNPLTEDERPLNHEFDGDPNVPIGETWVDQPYTTDLQQQQRVYRFRSLHAWTVELWMKTGVSIREKLTLFWHNHYVTQGINDPQAVYNYITLLRENALGNFRELTKDMTIEPSMLVYLNGNQNHKNAPNENYARELLELFTIGKGPTAGPGDYTNYTEDDVIEMARVLTGWIVQNGFSTDTENNPLKSDFKDNRHDKDTKQLSHRFNNITIENLDDAEYAYLIDIIFTKDECARFICRKLYRWFVYYDINAQVEEDVIVPMAQIMIDNDYEVKPALKALLESEHFFDMLSIGPMIKNPIDFVMGVFNTFEISFNESNLETYYNLMRRSLAGPLELMQMEPFNPPSVAGWKAYYQEPAFYRIWINSSTLAPRVAFTNQYLNDGIGAGVNTAVIDVLKFTASIDDPYEPNNLIDEFSKILFPQPIAQSQKDLLKTILIPGLPDFEWTVEYSDHINNPDDDDLANAVASKLRNLLGAMMSMPEYYLS